VVWAWTKEEDDAVMARLGVVQERLTKAGRMGPSLRLLPTTAATTLRKAQEPPLVIDGPFAETKEQLLGLQGRFSSSRYPNQGRRTPCHRIRRSRAASSPISR
jgi:hypothetical protein